MVDALCIGLSYQMEWRTLTFDIIVLSDQKVNYRNGAASHVLPNVVLRDSGGVALPARLESAYSYRTCADATLYK